MKRKVWVMKRKLRGKVTKFGRVGGKFKPRLSRKSNLRIIVGPVGQRDQVILSPIPVSLCVRVKEDIPHPHVNREAYFTMPRRMFNGISLRSLKP